MSLLSSLTTFTTAAAVAYAYQRPALDKAGLKLLGFAGMQATAIQISSFAISNLPSYAKIKLDGPTNLLIYGTSVASLTFVATKFFKMSSYEAVVTGLLSSVVFIATRACEGKNQQSRRP